MGFMDFMGTDQTEAAWRVLPRRMALRMPSKNTGAAPGLVEILAQAPRGRN